MRPFGVPTEQFGDDVAAEAMARELVEVTDMPGVRPSDGFTDRVMLVLADEPVPQPALMLRVALRRRRLDPALSAVRDAWRVTFTGPRPLAARAQGFALVVVVASD
jgi:hypothetical protein